MISFGCQNSKLLQPSDKLFIKGWVILPDSTFAVGASVRTDPPTEFATTDTKGFFIIQKGLNVGYYKFIAEHNKSEGFTKTRVEYGAPKKARYIVIKVGTDIVEPQPLSGAEIRQHPVYRSGRYNKR